MGCQIRQRLGQSGQTDRHYPEPCHAPSRRLRSRVVPNVRAAASGGSSARPAGTIAQPMGSRSSGPGALPPLSAIIRSENRVRTDHLLDCKANRCFSMFVLISRLKDDTEQHHGLNQWPRTSEPSGPEAWNDSGRRLEVNGLGPEQPVGFVRIPRPTKVDGPFFLRIALAIDLSVQALWTRKSRTTSAKAELPRGRDDGCCIQQVARQAGSAKGLQEEMLHQSYARGYDSSAPNLDRGGRVALVRGGLCSGCGGVCVAARGDN